MNTHDDPGTALYRQTLLDHGRRPRNRGALPSPPARRAEVRNRICGDTLTLYVELSGDRAIRARFEGQGCAISQAAASLLTVALPGRTRAEIARLSAAVRTLIADGDPASRASDRPPDLAGIGELAVLAAVAPHPARHPCALLALDALDVVLRGGA